MKKIAIVEDDPVISGQLADFLMNNGYECSGVTDYANCVEQILAAGADMVLLDLTLPGADGTAILKKVRQNSEVPIIILTSKNTEMDEVICMSYGADDFIAKPYNPAILLLHIEAVFKRLAHPAEQTVLTCGCLRLDKERGTLYIGEEEVDLTKNEMKILIYLMKHQGKIVAREELISYLWDTEEFVDDNTLTVNVNRVRTKLKEYGVEDLIRTKRGIGYVMG